MPAFRLFAISGILCAALAGQQNPLLKEWTTPFGVPPFPEFRGEHFLPALKQGIEEQRREVEAIAYRKDRPTFPNTIEALDAAGALLDRVESVFLT